MMSEKSRRHCDDSAPMPLLGNPMPFSAFALDGSQLPFDSRGPSRFDPASLLHGGEACEVMDNDSGSEESVEVAEEVPKQVSCRGSGSKRSRAAEVHNLSEKRRRSRINEKMKALQKLIPNSNKTDKASMLDEAIDYLKQLQLQVQMLSMRNGLTNLHPVCNPGAQQVPQICMPFCADNASTMNMGRSMLPLNRDTISGNMFHLPNQKSSSHQSLVPSLNINDQVMIFGMQSQQSQQGPYSLASAAEGGLCTEGIMDSNKQKCLDRIARPANEMQSMIGTTCIPCDDSTLLASIADHLEAHTVISQNMHVKNDNDSTIIQHMHGHSRHPSSN